MDGMGIGATSGSTGTAGSDSKGFAELLSDAPKAPGPVSTQSGTLDPGIARQLPKAGTQGVAMPDDMDFLVVDDVSVETTVEGDEVAVVSGEAVTAVQADAIAAKGGNVILPLSEPRFASRSISGSMFASMLIDQRNGILPNPFSLMRIPERPAAPADAATETPLVPNVAAPTPVDPMLDQAIPDAPGADAIAESKEMARLEAAISILIEKLEIMLKSMRVLVGNTARQQDGADKANAPPDNDISQPKY